MVDFRHLDDVADDRRSQILVSGVVFGLLDQATNEGLEVWRDDDDAVVCLLVDLHDLRLAPLSAGSVVQHDQFVAPGRGVGDADANRRVVPFLDHELGAQFAGE